ncbi:arginine/serine-rich protein PNISR isoform X2 [Meriones unguiculatus]|uniref:arginine/serine-rich protein PNISR isoform X2 n=1 Tax=Meriones unguiculatus TaxID=10047 RepID=UPI000B4F9950|nr:arginine/serine-rich protein PNISR isoform X2 [Meriones unguiculatus]
MWDQGGQPWQQWPLNQQQWMQSFQHQQDPSQIDWAALAQAWIAQREASGQQSIVEQPPGMMPNGQDMSTMESGPNNHGNFQGDSNFSRMWQPGCQGLGTLWKPHLASRGKRALFVSLLQPLAFSEAALAE